MPQTTQPPRLLLSIQEAARQLDTKDWSIYKLCDSGELESVYMGRRRKVIASSLADYVAGLPTTPPVEA